jgi:hypothetical protein
MYIHYECKSVMSSNQGLFLLRFPPGFGRHSPEGAAAYGYAREGKYGQGTIAYDKARYKVPHYKSPLSFQVTTTTST